MEVIEKIDPASSRQPTAVAIGNFDGVHRGHQALIHQILAISEKDGIPPAVLTFHPHPVEILRPGNLIERITTLPEKLALLEQFGVKTTFVVHFDQTIAALSAEAFFQRYLVKGLHARAISVGANFHFGKDRAGNPDLLRSLCRAAGIELNVMKLETEGEDRISSTRIRTLIKAGEISEAATLLGRPYFMIGNVVQGAQKGRLLGFPTANVQYAVEKVLPRTGVYFTSLIWNGKKYPSVSNIGLRPTVQGDTVAPVLETHVLEFHTHLYGEMVKIEFWEKLRDEQKFPSLDALKAQIAKDVELAKAFWSQR